MDGNDLDDLIERLSATEAPINSVAASVIQYLSADGQGSVDDHILVARLRGQYRIPISDGLGPAGGEEPDNPNEFVRTFPTTDLQREAADVIERLLNRDGQ